jgi:hypothetical protein
VSGSVTALTYWSSERRGQVKPNQINTPIDKEISQPETVTIADPRHPLYEQTFPLLHIQNKHELVLSCQIQIMPGANRLVPISLTDLATVPPDVFPVPLDISSLRKLTQAYRRIVAQVATEKRDGGEDRPPERGDSQIGVVNTRLEAATRGVEEERDHLPAAGNSTPGERRA